MHITAHARDDPTKKQSAQIADLYNKWTGGFVHPLNLLGFGSVLLDIGFGSWRMSVANARGRTERAVAQTPAARSHGGRRGRRRGGSRGERGGLRPEGREDVSG